MTCHKMIMLSGLVLASLITMLTNCATNVADGGAETGNARIVGRLYQPGGKMPAAGVRMYIRSDTSLADTSGAGLFKKLAATDSVVTDSTGRFAFVGTTLNTGTTYVITGASGNNAVLIDSVAVKNKTLTDTLAPDTLKPAGAIKGVIKLSEGGDPRKVFVLAFGIDRFAHVNADGSFKFQGLAEAAYDLRLISGLDNYGVLDTFGVPVGSADTTNLDTISLPFTGIPTPKNVKISYDTLKQIVTLTWSKADTALVKSYNIYRRNVDSNTVAVRINGSPVVDTVYRDSTGMQDQTYEYRVAAVNKNATEGVQSTGVSVTAVSVFYVANTLENPFGSYAGQIERGPNDIIVLRVGDNITILDTTLVITGSFTLPTDFGNGYGHAIDDSGRIWASNYNDGSVNIYSKLGNLLDSIRDTAINYPDLITKSPKAKMLVKTQVSAFVNEIREYDYEGNFVSRFPNDSTPVRTFITDMFFNHDGNLTILNHKDSLILVYDNLGNEVTRHKLSSHVVAIGQFSNGDYLIEDRGQTKSILILDQQFNGLGKIFPLGIQDFLSFVVDSRDRLITRNLSSIVVYKLRQ